MEQNPIDPKTYIQWQFTTPVAGYVPDGGLTHDSLAGLWHSVMHFGRQRKSPN